MKRRYDIIILGAGAAGLMCACEAGKRGRTVLLLDHAPKVGSKILISGGGQCNFTHLHISPENYISENRHFCKSVLARFTPSHFVALIEKHGIPYHERKSGQLFCKGAANQITHMLLKECAGVHVEILVNCDILRVAKPTHLMIETSVGVFHSDSLVVATGGLSYPKIGATALGLRLAKQFALSVIPTRPALVPLIFKQQDRHWGALAGICLDALVQCNRIRFRDNILFTHRGLSGPAILQISSYWNGTDPIIVNLFPETDFLTILANHSSSPMELRSLLARYVPKRLADKWCEHHGLSKPLNQYSTEELRQIAQGLRHWTITPAGTEGYSKAEVTRGGVDTHELSSKTLEARKVPGVYFIGEVVDVTGQLGGYNLQWAWSSGFAAGQFA